MPATILLHLTRDNENSEAKKATAALESLRSQLGFKLARVPTHTLPRALRDTKSCEVLCAVSTRNLSSAEIRSMRWAVHKRHDTDKDRTHRQLVCDLKNGDESRVRRPRNREQDRR